jgi:hypothetical protein
MKKIINLFAAFIIVALVFSCKDDNKNGEKFSEKSVEENKAIVEQSAISMVQTMEDLKNLQTTDAAVSLGKLLDQSDPMGSGKKKSKVNLVVHGIAGLKTGKIGIHELFAALKSPAELAEDPETLQEAWDQAVGTYTWNPGIQDWDVVAGGEEIVFRFPSVQDGTVNDAEFRVYDYAGVVISNPIEEEYSGDIPVSLKADLTVGGTTLLTYVFAAEYNNDGIPTTVASDLTIETFSLQIDFTSNESEVSANYKFTHNDETAMEVGGSAKGEFTKQNIEDHTITHTDTWTWTDYQWNEVTQTYEPVEITETDEWTEVEFQEIAHTGTVHLQLYNILLKGDVDIKNLKDNLDAIYPEEEPENFDWEAAANKEVEEINKYMKLRAIDVAANEKIAEAEAYVVHYIDEYYEDWTVDFRLKFGDGSYVDFETYFEEGFDDFVAEINSLINDLNLEYGWEIEPIDY